MKYGVIVCPKCKTAKGVNLSHKSTKCIKCNKNIIIDKVKILYKTDSIQELQNAIGLINAEIDGDTENFRKLLKGKKSY